MVSEMGVASATPNFFEKSSKHVLTRMFSYCKNSTVMNAVVMNLQWKGQVKDIILRLPPGTLFTSEMVRDLAKRQNIPEPSDHNSWGAIFREAKSQGLIQKTGLYQGALHCGSRSCAPSEWERTKIACRALPNCETAPTNVAVRHARKTKALIRSNGSTARKVRRKVRNL